MLNFATLWYKFDFPQSKLNFASSNQKLCIQVASRVTECLKLVS